MRLLPRYRNPVKNELKTTAFFQIIIGSFSKPLWRRRRERHQTKGSMSRTMAVHVRFESWYISLPSSAKQQREITGGSKTQVTGHCFTDTITTLTPFLMLTLGLSATIRQCFRPNTTLRLFLGLRLPLVKV